MSDYAQYLRANRSDYEKAERQAMAQVWRRLRRQNALGARLLYRAQQNTVARIVDELWFQPTSTGWLADR